METGSKGGVKKERKKVITFFEILACFIDVDLNFLHEKDTKVELKNPIVLTPNPSGFLLSSFCIPTFQLSLYKSGSKMYLISKPFQLYLI